MKIAQSMLMDPDAIAQKSYVLIRNELERIGFETQPQYLPIIERVVHSCADVNIAPLMEFNNDPIPQILEVFSQKIPLVCDTEMVRAGINKKILNKYGLEIYCYTADPESATYAASHSITRSAAGIIHALDVHDTAVFIIGNAPTALAVSLDAYTENQSKVKAIVGVPVGFVGAAESKHACSQSSVPSIVVRGMRGGSTLAVAIVNSLLLMMK